VHAFDQLPCPVLITDPVGSVLSINQYLLERVGGAADDWVNHPMEHLFPMASRIFLQTHVWPMLMREGQIREIRMQVLNAVREPVPVLVNCQKTSAPRVDGYTWVFFETVERNRYEHELLDARQRAEAAAAALANSEKFIRTVTDALPSMIAYWDNQLRCRFANQPYVEWFGKHPSKMLGMPMLELLGERLFALNQPYIQAALRGEHQEFERAIPKPDGSVGYTLANYIPDLEADGTVKGFCALVTNITRLREADAAIRLSASVFESTTEGIMVTDATGQIVSVNPAFTTLTGYAPMEVVGQNARILNSGRHDATFFAAMFQELRDNKVWKGDLWSKRRDGSIFLQSLSVSAICDDAGNATQYVGVFNDATARWDKEQLVRRMALHDGLTGLPNRSLLMERLANLIAMSAREPRQLALMFLDLDGFKKVNDGLGHEAGDQVLRTVAARLLDLLRATDTVARLGGDEFVIVLDNPESRDNIAAVATRVIEVVNAPIDCGGKTAHVGTSIGIAVTHNDSCTSGDLLKAADTAMYAAKAAGKNVFRFAD